MSYYSAIPFSSTAELPYTFTFSFKIQLTVHAAVCIGLTYRMKRLLC